MRKREIIVDKPDADGCIYVEARTSGTKIGSLTICPRESAEFGKTMRVWWSTVVKPFRRRGVATQLYAAAAREACRRGRRLESDDKLSAAAEKFWHKQVGKGRADRESFRSRFGEYHHLYALRCPAPESLTGTSNSSGLRHA